MSDASASVFEHPGQCVGAGVAMIVERCFAKWVHAAGLPSHFPSLLVFSSLLVTTPLQHSRCRISSTSSTCLEEAHNTNWKRTFRSLTASLRWRCHCSRSANLARTREARELPSRWQCYASHSEPSKNSLPTREPLSVKRTRGSAESRKNLMLDPSEFRSEKHKSRTPKNVQLHLMRSSLD